MTLRTYFLCLLLWPLCKRNHFGIEQNTIAVQIFLTLIMMTGFEVCWCTRMRYFYCPKSFTKSHYDEYVILSSNVVRAKYFLELMFCVPFFLSLLALTEMYGNSDGSVPATFQIYYMIGWKFHESQVTWSWAIFSLKLLFKLLML